MDKEELKKLIGKTIKSAKFEGIAEDCDDVPFLFLEMEDGSVFKIVADYGGYSGKSDGEYPRFISVEEVKKTNEKEE